MGKSDLDYLDERIAAYTAGLRVVLEAQEPDRDWDQVDAERLIRVARALNLLPNFCTRLEGMIQERQTRWRSSNAPSNRPSA